MGANFKPIIALDEYAAEQPKQLQGVRSSIF